MVNPGESTYTAHLNDKGVYDVTIGGRSFEAASIVTKHGIMSAGSIQTPLEGGAARIDLLGKDYGSAAGVMFNPGESTYTAHLNDKGVYDVTIGGRSFEAASIVTKHGIMSAGSIQTPLEGGITKIMRFDKNGNFENYLTLPNG